jgi:hypothetical protein
MKIKTVCNRCNLAWWQLRSNLRLLKGFKTFNESNLMNRMNLFLLSILSFKEGVTPEFKGRLSSKNLNSKANNSKRLICCVNILINFTSKSLASTLDFFIKLFSYGYCTFHFDWIQDHKNHFLCDTDNRNKFGLHDGQSYKLLLLNLPISWDLVWFLYLWHNQNPNGQLPHADRLTLLRV